MRLGRLGGCWLSVQLQLRSWSHGSGVRAPPRALCWQFGAGSLLWILCLPLSLPLPHSHSVFLFLSKINKHKENNNALGILSIVGVEVREGHLIALNRNNHGAPGWLSWFSVRLRLRSISRGLWVRVLCRALLTAQSLEPASDSVSLSLSAPPPLRLCLCLRNKH